MIVEKLLSSEMIGEGWLRLSATETEELGLPSFSGATSVLADGETLQVEWSATNRRLSGESLMDQLQLGAQVGWLARLDRSETGLSLRLVERRRSSLDGASARPFSSRPPTPTPRTKTTPALRRRRREDASERYRLRDRSEYDWDGPIGLRKASLDALIAAIRDGGWDDPQLGELRIKGERLAAVDQFEELMSVDVARVDRMPHQEAAARKILSEMRGRGILADEVGLGKTIEAGFIVKELTMRGLADKILILCPSALRDQWREELHEKFDEEFEVVASGPALSKSTSDRIIMTPQLAMSNQRILLRKEFDLFLLDEAHKYKGVKTRSVVGSLSAAARYSIFLTATPVQNELMELYYLVEALRPGTFPSKRVFKDRYMEKYDKRTPKDAAALRSLVSDVMVRTTRAQAGLDRVKRHTKDVPITLSSRERKLYDLCLDGLRNVLDGQHDYHRRRHLALRMTTSPSALAESALKMSKSHESAQARDVLEEIAHLAGEIDGSTRERKALQLALDWVAEHGRVILFSQHTATITGLARFFEAAGLPVTLFHGEMSHEARRHSIKRFKAGDAKVLLSSDAGAEGQNLQFCNCVINYDLPWNPMKIEQRIGRVDRMTQPQDKVFVANLFAMGTVDERVYELLHDKLAMFELLFGQVTTILGEIDGDDGVTFEARVLNALVDVDDEQMEERLSRFGSELANARKQAATAITSAGDLAWMVDEDRFEHRAGMSGTDAVELMPDLEFKASDRQLQVKDWVRDYLAALEIPPSFETDDFIAAQLPQGLAEQIGSTSLNMAFHRSGLKAHPEAELCAVGSELFDVLLDSLRVQSDLVARVPIFPEVETVAPTPTDPRDELELVSRKIDLLGVRGEMTLRLQVGNGTERIAQVSINGGLPSDRDLGRLRSMTDGESLPAKLIKQLPAQLRQATASGIADIATELEDQARRAALAEQTQFAENIESRLTEFDISRATNAELAEMERLSETLESLQEATASPSVELRCEALQLNLVIGDSSILREVWRSPTQEKLKVTRQFNELGELQPLVSGDGEPIQTLAFCRSGHAVDRSQVLHCSDCQMDFCGECAPQVTAASCILCENPLCSTCVDEGPCRTCREPEPTGPLNPELTETCALDGEDLFRISRPIGELIFVKSSQRAEVLKLDGAGQLTDWWTTLPTDLQGIRLDTQRQHGGPVAITKIAQPLTGPDPLGSIECTTRLGLTMTVRSGSSATEAIELTVVSDSSDAIEQSLLGDSHDHLRPSPPPDELEFAIEQVLASLPEGRPAGVTLEMVLTWHRESTIVTAQGFEHRTEAGPETVSVLEPFVPVAGDRVESFRPAPDEVVGLHHNGITVTRYRQGSNEIFELRHGDDEPAWVHGRFVPQETTRRMIGSSLDLDGVVGIETITDPAAIEGVIVRDGTLTTRSISPVPQDRLEANAPSIDQDVAATYLGVECGLTPEASRSAWNVESFAEIERSIDASIDPIEALTSTTIDVAFEIEDTWNVRGQSHTLRYVVSAGECHAVIEVVDSAELEHSIDICDDGHSAASSDQCPLCGRALCALCMPAAACNRCISSTPADPLDDETMDHHALWGLTLVETGVPAAGPVLMAKGSGRIELLVLAEDRSLNAIRSIEQPRYPSYVRRLHQLYRSEVELRDTFEAGVVDETPGALHTSHSFCVDTELRLGDSPPKRLTIHTPDSEPSTIEQHLLATLGDECPPIPAPVPDRTDQRHALQAIADSIAPSEGDRVVVELSIAESHSHETLTPDGLTVRSSKGAVPRIDHIPFARCRRVPELVHDFDPPATADVSARTGELEVTIVQYGRSRYVAVETATGARSWVPVRVVPDEAIRLKLQLYFGENGPVSVGRMVDPSTLEFANSLNGTLVSREWTACAEPPLGGEVETSPATAAAHLALGSGCIPSVESHDVGDSSIDALRATLEQRRANPALHRRIDVAYDITDIWNIKGVERSVTYQIAPGDHSTAIEVVDAVDPVSEFRICDEGHCCSDLAECWICGVAACAGCDEIVAACPTCGWAVCRTHGSESAPCTMCGQLEEVARKDHRLAALDPRWPYKAAFAELGRRQVATLTSDDAIKVYRRSGDGEWTNMGSVPSDASSQLPC